MKDKFLNFVRGVIIGLANIIPGISGATLAVSLGLYENIIDALGSFFKNKSKSFYFLLPICLGILIGVLSSSRLIDFCINKYYVQTIMFFIGLILGGMKLYVKKMSNTFNFKSILISLFVSGLVILSSLLIPKVSSVSFESITVVGLIVLLLVGILCGAIMIVPGISGAMMLIVVGYYEPLIDVLSDIMSFRDLGINLLMVFIFVIGFLIGMFTIAQLIYKYFKKYEVKFRFVVLGLIFSSIIVLLLQIESFNISLLSIISCFIILCWGYLLAINIDKE